MLNNFIMLAITAAGCIGFAVSNALQSVITQVVNWAMSSQLPQEQALNEATAELIDSHSGVICSVVAVIGTVFYAYIFDVLPSMTTLKEGLRRLLGGDDLPQKNMKPQAGKLGFDLKNAHFSLMGFTALDKVYNRCMELVTGFLDWLLDRENPEVIAARTTQEYRDRIMFCVREIDELDNEEYYTNAMHDPFIHNRFYKLQDELNRLTTISLEQKLDPHVRQLIAECRKRSQKILKDLERDTPKPIVRYDPICICLCGQSGTGKTKLMLKIARIIQEEMGLSEHNLCYPKGIQDAFWSKYKNQPIVLWDEFAQSRKMDEVIPEFMTLRGSTPVMLNMAAVNDKGKYFTSQAIIMTTNVPYEDFNAVRDNIAFKRRRHMLIRMSHRPGFNAQVMENARHDQFPNWEHCTFDLMNSMRQVPVNRDVPLDQMMNMIRLRVRTWHANQLANLASEDIPVELPRGLVEIPDQENLQQNLDLLMDREAQALRDMNEDGEVFEEAFQQDHVLEALAAQGYNPQVPPPDQPAIMVDVPLREDGIENGGVIQGEGDFEEIFEDAPEFHYCQHGCPLGLCKLCELMQPPKYEFHPTIPVLQVSPWTEEEYSGLIEKCALPLLESAAKGVESGALKVRSFVRQHQKSNLLHRLRTGCMWTSFKKGVSQLVEDAKAIFQNIKETVLTWIDNNPKIAKIVGVFTLFAGVGAVLYAFGESKPCEPEGFYQHGPQKMQRARLIPEGHYEHGPQKAKSWRMVPEGAEIQGNCDNTAMDIRAKIHPHICPITWKSSNEKQTGQLKCFRVGGGLILLPYHFFKSRVIGEKFSILHRFKWLEFEYDPSKLYRDGDRDWVLYDLGLRVDPAPHLFKYFISEKNPITKCRGMLCAVDKEGNHIIKTCDEVEGVKRFEYVDDYGETYRQLGWKVKAATVHGDCGAVLMGMGNWIVPPGKILGIHVCGFTDRELGFSVIITREMLESLAAKAGTIFHPVQVPMGINTTIDTTDLRIVPVGDFTIVGQMDKKKRVFQPMKTDLLPTPWASDIEEIRNPKLPAHLMPFISPDGGKISPLSLALPKYGQDCPPLPVSSMHKIESYLNDYFQTKLIQHTGKRVFTIQEAVNGIEGVEFAERINMKSSPGWPYQVEDRGLPGKFRFFDEAGNIIDDVLASRLTLRLHMASKGKVTASLWRDCLKDELRPVEKVQQGKTRLFTIAPLDFTIAVRQYFMDFIIAFYSAARTDFISAVGIDPESIDWTFLYNRLREVSDQAIAGDYSKFDGGLKPEVIELIGNLINKWYNASNNEDNIIRSTLFLEMCHTLHLVNDCVYMSHHGNKSGNPLTVIINTIANLIYLLCAWIKIYPHRPIEDFFEFCRTIIYGDDMVMTVGHQAAEFNQRSLTDALASFGIEFTTEDKQVHDVGPFRSLETVTFLKRGFRRDPEVGRMFVLPVMSQETLHSYLFWYRATEEDVGEQLKQNMRAAIDFAFFHGRDFYNWYNNLWKENMRNYGFNPLSITYDEQLSKFLHKCGAFGELTPAHVQGMNTFMNASNHKLSRFLCGVTESLFYYSCAAAGLGQSKQSEISDDRWAISIPSGEGKSTLCRQYPHIFVDHDDLLIPLFHKTSKWRLRSLPWRACVAREHDFPKEDRRILLVHSPSNTKRNLIGCFITPSPTYIRVNVFHRLLQDKPYVMEMDARNDKLLEIARQVEPGLFHGLT